MGQIYQIIDIEATVRDFGIKTIVETGTGIGESLGRIVSAAPRVEVYTIELMDELFNPIAELYAADPGVHPMKGYSHEVMEAVLSMMSPGPALFWHDAHFPGADFAINGAKYGDEPDPTKRIPFEAELLVIQQSGRDITSDIFISDDLRIYCDRPFAGGTWEERGILGGPGYGFVIDVLGSTHTIYESLIEQGMLIAYPKQMDPQKLMMVVQDKGIQVSRSHV